MDVGCCQKEGGGREVTLLRCLLLILPNVFSRAPYNPSLIWYGAVCGAQNETMTFAFDSSLVFPLFPSKTDRQVAEGAAKRDSIDPRLRVSVSAAKGSLVACSEPEAAIAVYIALSVLLMSDGVLG